MDGSECVGAIVCKLDVHRKVVKRGYIAMLAVDEKYRKRKIGRCCDNILYLFVIMKLEEERHKKSTSDQGRASANCCMNLCKYGSLCQYS